MKNKKPFIEGANVLINPNRKYSNWFEGTVMFYDHVEKVYHIKTAETQAIKVSPKDVKGWWEQ